MGFSGQTSRRRFFLSLTGLGATALLAACAPAATPTSAPAAKPAAPAAAAPTAAQGAAKPVATTAPVAAAKPAATAAPAAAAKPAAGAETIDFWFWADDPYQASLHTDSIKKFREKFPNIQVREDLITTVADQRKKIVTAFAAGSGMPDLSHAPASWLPEFNPAKMVANVEDRLKNFKTYADWQPNIIELSRGQPGSPVGLVTNQALVNYVYYRADWLKEANLQPPDTLDDVLKVATALNKPPDHYGFGFRGGDSGGFSQQLGHYLKGNGVEMVKADNSIDFDSPDAVATIQWYVDLYSKHKVTQPSAVTDRFPELFAGLQGGKLAVMHHGLWSWKTQESVLKEKVSAAPIPKGSKGRFTSVGVEGTMLYATSKKQDQSWELAAFLGEPEQVKLFMYERGSAAILKSMGDDPILRENRFYKAAMDSQPSWGQYPHWHKNWPKMNDRYAPEMQRLMKGEITAEQFAKTLANVLRG